MKKVKPIIALLGGGLILSVVSLAPNNTASGAIIAPPVLATGHINYAPGVTSGTVLVYAQPSIATSDKDTTEASINMPLIATANVGSTGTFALSTDPSKLPASVKEPDGSINVEVIAVSGTQQMSFFFPGLAVSTATGQKFVTDTTDDSATPVLQFDFVTGTAMNTKNNPAKWLNNNGRVRTPVQLKAATKHSLASPVTKRLGRVVAAVRSRDSKVTSAAAVVPAPVCGVVPVQTYYKARPEHFVNIYDDGSTSAHVSEGSSATHTLGIAVEVGGGGFTDGGTAHLSRSAAAAVTSRDREHSWGYWNKVTYQLFVEFCTKKHFKKPHNFYDFISADIDGAVQYQFFTASCGQKAKGDFFNTENATAATFGAGVDLPGVSLSAQTGYGSSENIHMKFLEGGSFRGNNPAGPFRSAKVDSSTFPCT